jgi:Rieske Fe-S protein
MALIGASGVFLWRFLVPRPKVQGRELLEIKRDEVPLRGALVYKRARVVVIRSEQEIYALSLVCPHLGCTVNVTAEQLVCPCHGSAFDREGNVLKGPSPKPLQRLEVRERGDKLVVLV